MRRFVAEGLSPEENRDLRAHLAQCVSCQDSYREAVRTTARIGAERREERIALERELRRRSLREDVFRAASPRGRRARIRTLLYPALLGYLMIQLGALNLRERGLELTDSAGTVHAAELVHQGEPVVTGPDGRARLDAKGGSVELARETRLWVERVHPGRLRLVWGSVELEGAWRLVSTLGAAELSADARARISLGPSGLECECLGGELTLSTSTSERRLSAGERMLVEPQRATLGE